MITLYQFPAMWNIANPSVFCMKIETYLRMVNLPFTLKIVNNPRKAPKGKLPYIKAEDGTVIADSDLILIYLKEKYGNPLDEYLSAEQQAIALAIQRMLEEHLYWVIVYSRWTDPEGWSILKQDFFGQLALPQRELLAFMVRKHMQRELYYQGIGRHSATDIYHLGLADLKALEVFLGERPFFLGDDPTSIDACTYSFITNLLHCPAGSPLKTYAQSKPAFAAYCERMRERYYK